MSTPIGQIVINGKHVDVFNAYSPGPGCRANTFDVRGGWLQEIGGVWTLHEPGAWPREVEVEIPGGEL